jgi:hypothetical protein
MICPCRYTHQRDCASDIDLRVMRLRHPLLLQPALGENVPPTECPSDAIAQPSSCASHLIQLQLRRFPVRPDNVPT